MIPGSRNRRRQLASAVVVLAAAGCVSSAAACVPLTGSPGPSMTDASSPAAALTAEINQFRDNYGKQIIELQLTNTSAEQVTVHAAGVTSPLFSSPITWEAAQGGAGIPPGQTKSLPAQLPAARCGQPAVRTTNAGPAGGTPVHHQLMVGLSPGGGRDAITVTDPYGVLERNNVEMCLAQAVGAVAGFELLPALEVSPDAATAVVRLSIRPRGVGAADGGASPAAGMLTIDSIEGTTLLAEDPHRPWPREVGVTRGGPPVELQLHIRPARCDPHAVAEDKVGTLIPLRLTVGGRQGVFKVSAGPVLKGAVLDFVTGACARH